ncbi:MAG: alanine racemase [Oscillospiraceae bacterium]|nr:alanine racemase [Oscillospiraceae bacterium]
MDYKTDRRTWAKIDLDAIRRNVGAIEKLLEGKSKIMAIVKADAYGHGAPFVARELAWCGVDFFGVSSLDEAAQLREAGIGQNILILGYTAPIRENIKKLVECDIIQTVFDFGSAKEISEIAKGLGAGVKLHIKIDTGMNRLGFSFTKKNQDKDLTAKIKSIKNMDNIVCEGIFTHFAAADDKNSSFTKEQFGLFCGLVDSLEKENIHFGIKHAANSGATINFRETHLDYVRCGLILYGLCPWGSSAEAADTGLVPAMELKTIISEIHTVKKGETVSYGRTYKSKQDILCATLPIGYADGFSRLLSNSANVLINGKSAPVIGRVCMDQSIIDVTDCGSVKVGDEVTLFGHGANGAGYIPVEQVAEMMGTINYEVVCLIGKRVPRVFYKNGKEYGQLNYIAPGHADFAGKTNF